MKYEDATPEEQDAIDKSIEVLNLAIKSLDANEHPAANGVILAQLFISERKKLESNFPNSVVIRGAILGEFNKLYIDTVTGLGRYEKSN